MIYNAKNGSVKIGDTSMDFVCGGSGEKKLIILPGLSEGLTTVKGKAIFLLYPYRKYFDRFTVYMFSRKKDMPKGYSIQEMAADQAAVMTALGIDKACVLGVSQGGTKALATGFANLERFGYIGSFAPDPGTVPSIFRRGTIWNAPLLKHGFPEYDERLEPYYVYLSVGADDPENVEVTKYYGYVLDKMGYKNQTDVVPGYEHDYIFWRLCFYNFINKIFRP